MTNAEEYIEKYKELEKTVRRVYGLRDSDSISYYLTKQDKFKKYKAEIKLCQSVRNVLQHEKRLGDGYAVEPHDEMLRFLDELTDEIGHRSRCIDIATRSVYSRRLTDRVRDAMTVMRKNSYNYVPILEGKAVIALFGMSSVFDLTAEKDDPQIGRETTFADISDYLGFDRRKSETFVFVKPDMYVEELEELFEEEVKNARRISVAFVTKNGEQSGKLMGLITPWDLFKAT